MQSIKIDTQISPKIKELLKRIDKEATDIKYEIKYNQHGYFIVPLPLIPLLDDNSPHHGMQLMTPPIGEIFHLITDKKEKDV